MLEAFIDYLTFTWAPKELEAMRSLSTKVPDYRDRLEKLYQEAKRTKMVSVDGRYFAIDLNEYDEACFSEIQRFFETTNPFYGKYIEIKERGQGMFGYRKSWEIHVEGVTVGMAAAGAKNGGCMISITGAGCGSMDRQAMYNCLQVLPYSKITRIDLAHDDYAGKHSVDVCRALYKNGSFVTRGAPPSYKYFEGGILVNGKLKPSSGRSFYVGSRESGKMLRCYEKGKQLSHIREVSEKNINWTRWELELRSAQRSIPLDVLLKPAEYLRDSYPAMAFMNENQPVADEQSCVIRTKKKSCQITLGHLKHHAKKAYGPLLNVLRQLDISDTEIVNQLISKPDAIPKRLDRAMVLSADIKPEEKPDLISMAHQYLADRLEPPLAIT